MFTKTNYFICCSSFLFFSFLNTSKIHATLNVHRQLDSHVNLCDDNDTWKTYPKPCKFFLQIFASSFGLLLFNT